MIHIDPSTRDFVQLVGGDFQPTDNLIRDAMLRRLRTERGSCVWDLTFGSGLAAMSRQKAGPSVVSETEARVREALAPMLRDRRLQDLQVAATREAPSRVAVAISARDSGWRPIAFTLFLAV